MNNTLIPIIVALISLLGGGWAFITSLANDKRVKAMEQSKVDAQAFQRAKDIYESGLSEMGRQVKFLQDLVHDERTSAATLRKRVNELEEIISKMRTQMLLAGITTYDFDKELENDPE